MESVYRYSELVHVPSLDAWALPCLSRLSEFYGAVLNCFTLSRPTIFTDVSLSQTGRRIHPIGQGNALVGVMDHGSGNWRVQLEQDVHQTGNSFRG